MKSLEQLIDHDDPALPLIQQLLAASEQHCQLLPPSPDNDRILLGLQVTTRSLLGAIAHQSGGLLVDHGWLRILGSGHPLLPRNLLDWNNGRADGHLLVADDAVGGFFSINGDALGEDLGAMYYWAPDTLHWEALQIGYSDFLAWVLSDRLALFYQELRWEGWQNDVQQLDTQQCFTFFPYLWTEEGSVSGSHRQTADVAEQYALNVGLGEPS